MKLKITEKKFVKFLKENDAYENYIKNKPLPCYPDILIMGAFAWDETEQGIKYWSNLNAKWYKELQKGE